jgi:hypothetical protein
MAAAHGWQNPSFRAAPTGVAAHGISGCTLHYLFRLPIKSQFTELSAPALSAVRNTLRHAPKTSSNTNMPLSNTSTENALKNTDNLSNQNQSDYPTRRNAPPKGVDHDEYVEKWKEYRDQTTAETCAFCNEKGCIPRTSLYLEYLVCLMMGWWTRARNKKGNLGTIPTFCRCRYNFVCTYQLLLNSLIRNIQEISDI